MKRLQILQSQLYGGLEAVRVCWELTSLLHSCHCVQFSEYSQEGCVLIKFILMKMKLRGRVSWVSIRMLRDA